MADAPDSKSGTLKGVWVQVPPSVFSFLDIILCCFPVIITYEVETKNLQS